MDFDFQKLIDGGLAVGLIYFGLKTMFPQWWADKKVQDSRLDSANDKLATIARDAAAHIAVANVKADASAQRDELLISTLQGLRSSFDIFSARDEERQKADKELRRINEEQWKTIGQELSHIRQNTQIANSSRSVDEKINTLKDLKSDKS